MSKRATFQWVRVTFSCVRVAIATTLDARADDPRKETTARDRRTHHPGASCTFVLAHRVMPIIPPRRKSGMKAR